MDLRARNQMAAALFSQGAPEAGRVAPRGGAAALTERPTGLRQLTGQGPGFGQQAAELVGYHSTVKPAVGMVEYGKGPGNAQAHGLTSRQVNRAVMSGDVSGIPTGYMAASRAWQLQDDERKRRQGFGFNPVSGLLGIGASALGMPAVGGLPGLAGRIG